MKTVRTWRWTFLEPRRRVVPKTRVPAPLAKDVRPAEVPPRHSVVVGEQDDFSDTLPRVFWPELRG